ncbi:MAG: hypothetical protein V4717_04280 [Bacteroidota bacterium]
MTAISKMMLLVLFLNNTTLSAQTTLKQKAFFNDTSIIPVTFSTDMGNLTSGKIKDGKQPGRFTATFNEQKMTGKVIVNTRGKMRKSICFIPPLKIDFLKDSGSFWGPLKTLKLVSPCESNPNYEQLLVKEYLVYKMYNVLTDLSFKVRLLQLTYEDEKGKKKPITQYAFFLEDEDQMAKRNQCISIENNKYLTDATDYNQITLTCIFEYMIGNTDWSVPNNHNIRLIRSKKDSFAKPIAVPYDFDYSGIVNAPYATPDPELEIQYVTERLYRGFPRKMEQLEPIIQKFKDKKADILAVVNNCMLLKPYDKKEMISYLEEFYKQIDKPSTVKTIFMDRARTQ